MMKKILLLTSFLLVVVVLTGQTTKTSQSEKARIHNSAIKSGKQKFGNFRVDVHQKLRKNKANRHQEIALKSAQAVKQRLDSYSYQELEEDGEYEKGKTEFVYDVNGMLTLEREYFWDETSGKMILSDVSETTYDAAKNVIQIVYSYLDETSNQFIVADKETYSYDKSGNMIQLIRNYWDDTNKNTEEFKTVYTYDSAGNLIQEISSSRNETSSQFGFRYKTDYKYNGNGKETQVISYIWDSYFSKQWEPSSKIESTYDSQGNLVSWINSYYTYIDNTLAWKFSGKEEYTYNTKGQLTQTLEYYMGDNNQWELDDKEIRVYVDQDNYTQNIYYYNWDVQTSKWMGIDKEEYTYNNSYTLNDLILPWDDEDEFFTHMLTAINGYDCDSTTNEWVSYYQMSLVYSPVNMTSVHQVDAHFVNVYPNPCSDGISISFPGNYSQVSFDLFDLQGRKIISKQIGNNEKINMQGLNSGLYLYTLNLDGKIQKGKLIKEY